MAKDPAFLFYPGDYIGGTMHLDFICKGAYIDLLMLQFNRGHMTLDMIKHMLGETYGQVWGQIEDKFLVETENGTKYYYNDRLRIEKGKRQKYVESRTNNKKGSNQYNKSTKKPKGHMSNHMEDENKNEDNIVKEIVYPFDSEKFHLYWNMWKQYKRKEHKFNYKSKISEQAALKKLGGLAQGIESNCYDILENSIANGYKGFFKAEENKKNNLISDDYKQQILNELNDVAG